MIEEIKKEIEDAMWDDGIAMTMDKLFKILDKHNTMYPDYKDLLYQNDSLHSELQELKDYKKMWKELKQDKLVKNYLLEYIQELEQKYLIGRVENDKKSNIS